MRNSKIPSICVLLGFLVVVDGLAGFAGAENHPTKAVKTHQADLPEIEMFAAMESGKLEVQLIPTDSTRGHVLLKNNTDLPLNVKLPEAFAGLPVLAQFGGGRGGRGGGMGGMGMGGGGMGGMSQGMGGGMGGMGMGGGGMGMGGGFFNVEPGKARKIQVPLVCLEHGKPDPRPRIPYVIKPLEEVSDSPEVYELCSMLGYGQIDQRAAQVAAWHLQNKMSWNQLATKEIRHLNGFREPYFTSDEIYRGMLIVRETELRAESRPRTLSPGEKQEPIEFLKDKELGAS